ncbi:MAG: SDR family NAD(P)-dependent oxidoreductase [Pseudomonadota bacterium]
MAADAPIAIVTGATAGIGAAVARGLHEDGFRIVSIARRVERLKALGAELGARVIHLACDISDPGALAALPSRLPEGWREPDILVNNAGLALGQARAQEAQLEDWELTVAVNVLGPLRLIHALLPGMVARGKGRIINIGSVAARYPYPGGNAYAASKAFLETLTANLKADLIGTGVHSTTIAPGLVGDTEFSSVRFAGDEAKARSVYEGLEHLRPDDVADAVRWIAARPAHVNINYLEIMPNCQAPGPLVFNR